MSDVTSYDIKTTVQLWSASDTNEKWRNGKLVKSLLHTDCILKVFIMSCGLCKSWILSTRGKKWVKHVANMRERCVQVLVGKPEGKRLLISLSRRWEDNIKLVLQWVGFVTWTEIVCFRTRTSVVCFWLWQGKFGFYKTLGISWQAEKLLASEEGTCLIGIIT